MSHRLHMPILSLLWRISCGCQAPNEMCPIKGMENNCAYLAEHCTSLLLFPPKGLHVLEQQNRKPNIHGKKKPQTHLCWEMQEIQK
uniref:Secreted protein n=1 Tax=Amphiprion ocellaris TaxID=80972 RepID=A0AAQ5Y9U0_AMPOC